MTGSSTHSSHMKEGRAYYFAFAKLAPQMTSCPVDDVLAAGLVVQAAGRFDVKGLSVFAHNTLRLGE